MKNWSARIELSADTAKKMSDDNGFYWIDEIQFDQFPTLSIFENLDDISIWYLDIYLPFPPQSDDATRLFKALEQHANLHISADAFEEIEDMDWVSESQKLLEPIIAGRFVAFGEHDSDNVDDGLIHLLVEAGQAFGTGSHGTTKGCLLALSGLYDDGISPSSALDVGTGSGILAMAAWRLWDIPVLATDNDPVATETAAITFKANNVEARAVNSGRSGIGLVTAEGFDTDAIQDEAPFDLIIANILALPIIEMAPDIERALSPKGHVILSGLLKTQESDVVAAYKAVGLVVEKSYPIAEWQALLLKRV